MVREYGKRGALPLIVAETRSRCRTDRIQDRLARDRLGAAARPLRGPKNWLARVLPDSSGVKAGTVCRRSANLQTGRAADPPPDCVLRVSRTLLGGSPISGALPSAAPWIGIRTPFRIARVCYRAGVARARVGRVSPVIKLWLGCLSFAYNQVARLLSFRWGTRALASPQNLISSRAAGSECGWSLPSLGNYKDSCKFCARIRAVNSYSRCHYRAARSRAVESAK